MRKRYWIWGVLGVVGLFLPACATMQTKTVAGSGGGIRVGPVRVEIHIHNRALPVFRHGGRRYIAGERGVRYSIALRNYTSQRLEALVAVDGRDVINGRAARAYHRRGYILNPHTTINIDGFRVSRRTVAAFRFSSIERSYAARSGGSWHKIGRIHVAIFRERRRVAYIPRPTRRHRRYHLGKRSRRGANKASPPGASGKSRKKEKRAAPRHRGQSKSRSGRAYRHYRRPHYPRPKPQLGTKYGERRYSPVRYTTFHRATSSPSYTRTLHYNSCAGFRSIGICTPVCGCYRHRRPPYVPHYPRRRYSKPPPNWPHR